MPGQFKISGTRYIAKNGVFGAAGTATDPWAAFSNIAVGASPVMVGAGYYKVTSFGVSIINGIIDTDGRVILDFNNSQPGNLISSSWFLQNVIIVNPPISVQYRSNANPVIIIGWKGRNVANNNNGHTNANFIGVGTVTNYSLGAAGNAGTQSFCAFFDCAFQSRNIVAVGYNNCYMHNDTIMTLMGLLGEASITDNCINGLVRLTVGGTLTELKYLRDGSPRPDANGAIADTITIFPNVYTRGNYASVNTKILDKVLRIAEADSDLIAFDVGYFSVGEEILVSDDNGASINITTVDIDTTDPDEYVVDPLEDEGYVDYIVQISGAESIVPRIEYKGNFYVDSDETPGTALNENAPDSFPLSNPLPTTTNVLPNRLTYLLRTSKQVAKPTSDGEWDNDFALAGTFYPQQYGSEPRLRLSSGVYYGSGEEQTADAPGDRIRARWIHVRAYIRNNRDY